MTNDTVGNAKACSLRERCREPAVTGTESCPDEYLPGAFKLTLREAVGVYLKSGQRPVTWGYLPPSNGSAFKIMQFFPPFYNTRESSQSSWRCVVCKTAWISVSHLGQPTGLW